jgi:hypothetical protein
VIKYSILISFFEEVHMAGKYTLLGHFLKNSANNDLTLSFADIERIINDELPKAANEHRAWWANEVEGNHVEAHAWMGAGWRVEHVDLNRKVVRFVRF